MTGGLGPYGAKTCSDLVKEFMQCRRHKGMTGMLSGECTALYRQMNACLDTESEIRRRENLQAAKERMAKFNDILCNSQVADTPREIKISD